MEAGILWRTATSLTWEILDQEADYHTEEYTVYLDGQELRKTDKTIDTVFDLEPDREYTLAFVRGEEKSALCARTLYEYVTLNVRDFGAKGDGESDDTAALQAAILTAPKDSRVYVPAGVYRFTHLFLKSDLNLEIAKDAVLRAIPDKYRLPLLPGRIETTDHTGEFLPASWEGEPKTCFASILTGINLENVVIYGEGTIDGAADFDNWWNVEKRKGDPARPRMLFLNHCQNATLVGVTIRNSPSWNLHPYFSNDLHFLDLKIQSPPNSHNTDGMDPESCQNVEIAGIYFSVGDDCIAVKSGKIYMGKTYKTPSKNILIRNCLMERGHGGVTIGSEIAAGVDDINIRNCHFVDTDRGLRVKTRRGRGKDSVLTGIHFEHVRMDGVKNCFVINSFYYCGADGKTEYVGSTDPYPVDDRTPYVGQITIRNVTCRDAHVAGVYFYGLPESKIQSVEMENVTISFAEDAKTGRAAMMKACVPGTRQGIFIRNAKSVRMKNVVIEGGAGKNVDLEGVDEWIRE